MPILVVYLLLLLFVAPSEAAPASLRETGIAAPGVQAFSPQYPLWSDGSDKRRWVQLPPGGVIDASDPDAWVVPPGTKFRKEFALAGRPVETRYIERRADGSWDFASYVWNAEGTQALLAPARGVPALPVAAAPNGRYAVPSRGDCLACHGGGASSVLGFSALQLSPDRDPLAVHGRQAGTTELDLRALVRSGRLKGDVPGALVEAPRIEASTPVERAALGYLHANCSHCHNSSGTQVPVLLDLAQSVRDPKASRLAALASLRAPARYQPGDQVDNKSHPAHALLALRMQSRDPLMQMPPLGTQIPDPEGLALILRWMSSAPLELPR